MIIQISFTTFAGNFYGANIIDFAWPIKTKE